MEVQAAALLISICSLVSFQNERIKHRGDSGEGMQSFHVSSSTSESKLVMKAAFRAASIKPLRMIAGIADNWRHSPHPHV